MRRRITATSIALAATVALWCAVAQAAGTKSYSGKLTGANQTSSFMGADVISNGKGVPTRISIGFSNATAFCNGAPILNGQVGGIQNAKLKKKGKKFTFKGTGVQGPGTATIAGKLSKNGRAITGQANFSAPLGPVTCTLFSQFALTRDGKK
jgi:hypothetical protein